MNIAWGLLIVAANLSAPIDVRHPDAVEMFHCGFEPADDREYDGWPDGWTRKRGTTHPAYLPARIVETAAPEGHAALRIDLNGGAATILSPDIEVKPLFSYVVEGFVRTEGLKHDRAWFSVTFYDAQHDGVGNVRFAALCRERRLAQASQWGRLAPPNDRAALCRHRAASGAGRKADLNGAAQFDDIWLGRLPRMSLSTNSVHNVYTDPSQIEITCQVSGHFRP